MRGKKKRNRKSGNTATFEHILWGPKRKTVDHASNSLFFCSESFTWRQGEGKAMTFFSCFIQQTARCNCTSHVIAMHSQPLNEAPIQAADQWALTSGLGEGTWTLQKRARLILCLFFFPCLTWIRYSLIFTTFLYRVLSSKRPLSQ